jgi:hypothetical protein
MGYCFDFTVAGCFQSFVDVRRIGAGGAEDADAAQLQPLDIEHDIAAAMSASGDHAATDGFHSEY